MPFETIKFDNISNLELKPTGCSELSESVCFGDRPCANCQKKDSTLWCGGCQVRDIGKIRVFYCSKACQGSHWKTHQRTCKTRRKFFRAVSIISELWIDLQQKTWTAAVKLDAVSDKVISISRIPDNLDPRGWTGGSIFRKVSDDVFLANADDAVKQAVLFDTNSDDIVLTGQMWLDLFFRATGTTLQFAEVEVNGPAMVVRHEEQPNSNGHGILIAKLATGDDFALDFMGAQFGWKEKLYDREVFYNHRSQPHCFSRFPPKDFINMESYREKLKQGIENPDKASVSAQMLRQMIVGATRDQINEFTGHHTGGLKAILGLQEDRYSSVRSELMNAAFSRMDEMILRFEQRGVTRLFYDLDFQLRTVSMDENMLKWQMVWLTEAEYQANCGNLKGLKDLWTQKLAPAKVKWAVIKKLMKRNDECDEFEIPNPYAYDDGFGI